MDDTDTSGHEASDPDEVVRALDEVLGAPIETTSVASAQRARIAQSKAAVLREALPWMTRFHGQTVVVKYGGNAMVEEGLKRSFAADVALLRFVGLRPVIVHGGGPQIDALATARGVTSRFVGGLRVTDADMLAVVREALVDEVGALVAAGSGPPATFLIVHGLADDNVLVAHSLRLTEALLAAGIPFRFVPLTTATHMAGDPTVAARVLELQADFLAETLSASATSPAHHRAGPSGRAGTARRRLRRGRAAG